jgi:hypothetical protein
MLAVGLFALLLLILTGRHVPPRQLAGNMHAHLSIVRNSAETTRTRARTAARQAPIDIRRPPVVDALCGLKGTALIRAGNESFARHVMRVTQTAISAWKTALAASDDPRRQAVALALENAHPDAPGEKPKDTPVNDGLVLLAIDTNDPVIYALALRHCGGDNYDMAAGPCQGLSWEHWANIDPDNAAPWLELAAKADSFGDQQGVENALAEASKASRIDSYGSTVVAIALNALPRNMAPLDKAVAGADVIYGLGMSTPALALLQTLCSDVAIEEPTRRQQCTSIANDLADRATTLLDVGAAAMLGKRLGFPADRQTRLELEWRNDNRAFVALTPWHYTNGGSGFTLASDFGCNTVLGYGAYIDALEAAGGNERAALAAIGRTLRDAR